MTVERVHFYEGCQVGKIFSKCPRSAAESNSSGWQVREVGRKSIFSRGVRLVIFFRNVREVWLSPSKQTKMKNKDNDKLRLS